ncbi:hypothetical protein F4810DRAFT_712701 [Camillea tinctor]|nr:hypothetical protein F4810DRAFT_712701 [Camillea tinctor]
MKFSTPLILICGLFNGLSLAAPSENFYPKPCSTPFEVERFEGQNCTHPARGRWISRSGDCRLCVAKEDIHSWRIRQPTLCKTARVTFFHNRNCHGTIGDTTYIYSGAANCTAIPARYSRYDGALIDCTYRRGKD